MADSKIIIKIYTKISYFIKIYLKKKISLKNAHQKKPLQTIMEYFKTIFNILFWY